MKAAYADLLHADTLTGRYMKQTMPIKTSFRPAKGKLAITNARVNNLQNVSVDIPAGVLTVVTGVAGSGKSSLIHQEFSRQHPDAVVIDQSAVGTLQPLQSCHVHRYHGRCPQSLRGR